MTKTMARLRSLYRRHTYFAFLFLSYLALLLCTLILGFSFYVHALNSTRRAAAEQQTIILNQSAMVVDSYLTSARTELLNVAQNQLTTQVARLVKPLTIEDYYKEYQLIQFLSRRSTENPALLSLYLYYPNLDCVFTESSKYAGSEFYRSSLYEQSIPYAEWQGLARERHFISALPTQSVAGAPEGVIPIMQSIPVTGPEPPGAVAVAHISVEAIHSIFGQFLESGSSTLYILDNRSNLIASIGPGEKISFSLQLAEQAQNGMLKLEGERYVTASFVSPSNGWRYITTVPERIALRGALKLRSMLFFVLLGELGIGLLLSYLLAKSAHFPLVQLENRYSAITTRDGAVTAEKNEFLHIEKLVEQSIRDKESMQLKIDHYAPILTAHILLRMITGCYAEPDELERLAQESGIHLDAPKKQVLVFRIEETAGFFSPDPLVEQAMVKFVLLNILDDLFSHSFRAYMCEVSYTDVAVLLGIDSPDGGETALVEHYRYARTFMLEKFGVCILAATGKAYDALSQMSLSFSQAMDALQYGTVEDDDRPRAFQVDGADAGRRSIYPFGQFEEILKNFIHAADREKAIACIEEAVRWQEGGRSPQSAQCHFYSLMSVALRLTADSTLCPDLEETARTGIAERITQCASLTSLQKELTSFVGEACSYSKAGVKNRQEILHGRITALVDEEYSNPDLCLTLLADRLHMNPSYLSAFFKKQSGQNLIDYISVTRIRHAEELLVQTDLDIAMVAVRVGFSSYNALIRSFKKQNGVTPGQFRSIRCGGK